MGKETIFTWRGLLVRKDNDNSFWICHPDDKDGMSGYPHGLVTRTRTGWDARLTLGRVLSYMGTGNDITAALENALGRISELLPQATQQLEQLTASR